MPDRPRPRWTRHLPGLILVSVLVETSAGLGFALLNPRHRFYVEPAYSGQLSSAQRESIGRLLVTSRYLDYSATLGWTIRPNGRAPLYRANAHGIRASREYTIDPPAGVVRIAAFGDSFTHGDQVANTDTWTHQLERLHPGLEVLNFGVGGFGADQALLRYETEGVRFHPHIVLLGFLPENINRVVSVFRPFYVPDTGIPMSKPRFVLRDGQLALLPNPIPTRDGYRAILADPATTLARLGERDYFYQRSSHHHWTDASRSLQLVRLLVTQGRLRLDADPILVDHRFNTEAEAFKLLRSIVVRFGNVAARSGARPVLLILPGKDDLAGYRESRSRKYAPLLAVLDDARLPYIDLMTALAPHDLDALFAGHYTPFGNRVVATHLRDALLARGLIPPRAPSRSAGDP